MVYYRKYRPQTLQEVIGQQNITETLIQAFQSGNLAHAYLFTGPRGTGKTSTARILAKMVNCEKSIAKVGKEVVAGSRTTLDIPCNSCDSCLSIIDGSALDYIEIDAASNRGIDDMRQLRENIKLSPSSSRKKVYVIDECFRYEDLITLEDGTKLPIGQIVEQQLPVKVLSYNRDTFEIEPKQVVRYMKKRPELPTVQITFNNNRSLVCTLNHRFYTPEGQIRACDLKKGQFVYAHYEQITQQQLDVIAGAALGDGHIALTTSGMRGRLSISQGIVQKDYLEYKTQLLGDLVQTPPSYQFSSKSFTKKGIYRVATLSRSQIAKLHRSLYDDVGKKRVSSAYLEQLTPLSLAIWYLDDGSLLSQKYLYKKKDGIISHYLVARSVFSIQGLSIEDAEVIKEWFRTKWGIKGGISKTAKGPVFWLTVEGTKQLHEIIASYVPPSMNYKLLSIYQNRFSLPMDNKIPGGMAISIVKNIQEVDPPEFVYNIEVADNHNYFARDILVANCHMLTMEAFNGFLKTLEEPPAHVLFILATTEAQKIPATILSRVQRLDFQLAKTEDLLIALENVVAREKLEIESEALKLIAKRAEGSFRDAVKHLDQLASSGQKITLEMVEESFKSGSFADALSLLEAIAQKDPKLGLDLVNKQTEQGTHLKEFTHELLEILRSLLLAKHGAQIGEKDTEKLAQLKALGEKFDNQQILKVIDSLHQGLERMKTTSLPVLALEVAVVEASQSDERVSEVSKVPKVSEVSTNDTPDTTDTPPIISDKIQKKLEESKIEGSIPEASTPANAEDLGKLLDKWNYILETIKPYNYSLEALLRQVKVTSCEDGLVILEVPYSFHQRILEAPKSRDLLESVISEVLGKPGRMSCVLGQRPVRVEEIANIELAADDDVIKIAAEIFNS